MFDSLDAKPLKRHALGNIFENLHLPGTSNQRTMRTMSSVPSRMFILIDLGQFCVEFNGAETFCTRNKIDFM